MYGLSISIVTGLGLFTIGGVVVGLLPEGSSWGYGLFYFFGITHVFVYVKLTDKWLW
jgi:hypothetical protein